MKNRVVLIIACIAATILSIQPSMAVSDKQADENMKIAAGKAVFTYRCMACHSLDRSKNAFAPSLYGIVGRDSGLLPRYKYSKAMENADLVWTEKNLRKWIEDNEKLIPQTRMRHVSITDTAEQDFLINFLKSLD